MGLFYIIIKQNQLTNALQSCTGSVQDQNRVFPVKFSTQGKACFHYREPLFSLQGPLFSLQGFPCEKTSQGNPCFQYREWVCSVEKKHFSNFSYMFIKTSRNKKKLNDLTAAPFSMPFSQLPAAKITPKIGQL